MLVYDKACVLQDDWEEDFIFFNQYKKGPLNRGPFYLDYYSAVSAIMKAQP